ncbi:MAG: ferritin-like protein [Myxococcales bacterium]|nr:ferritin-like protein [Myxococcales bacterium]
MSAIKTVACLKNYLYRAMQLEHATIPTYLTALYSIHPQTNSDAFHIIRVVVVEEMLHLTIAANLMNAIGGEVDLTKDGFLPDFPTYLPDGETDFQVDLACLAPSTIQTFLQIERPSKRPEGVDPHVACGADHRAKLAVVPCDDTVRYYSIGDFYAAIAQGLKDLDCEYKALGKDLFCGDPARQITSEYYYSGGGTLEGVYDLDSALRMIDLVSSQGEGELGEPYDAQGELAHFYRFEQLLLGQYYQPGDAPHAPTGPACEVDWDAVYPAASNLKLSQIQAQDPELAAAAQAFNRTYFEFLQLLTEAFSGAPETLMTTAVPYMFRLRNGVNTLVRNPLAGTVASDLSAKYGAGEGPAHAAPTFEMGMFTK